MSAADLAAKAAHVRMTEIARRYNAIPDALKAEMPGHLNSLIDLGERHGLEAIDMMIVVGMMAGPFVMELIGENVFDDDGVAEATQTAGDALQIGVAIMREKAGWTAGGPS